MPRSELRKNLLIALCALLAAGEASAQNVFVMSISGNHAQVIINSTVVRVVRVGETTPEGVRLVDIRGGAAVFDIGGKPVALGLGQATVVQTVLRADSGGHFMTHAMINGVTVPAIIDTGATDVTVNMVQAQRMGLDLRGAQRVRMQTANGLGYGWVVPLASVQVGDIVLRNVVGKVVDGGAETLPIALIGMSFLKHVEMHRSGATMTLSRPHLQ